MKILEKVVGGLVIFLLLFSSVSITYAEEVEIKQLVPMFLSGTVTIGENIAPPGTVIEADLLGYFAGSAVVMSDGVYGNASFPMMVQAGENETYAGETVTFWVNGVQAEETILYDPGLNLDLNLTFPQPAKPKMNRVPKGGDVFIGEEGLDITEGIGTARQIAWWQPGTNTETEQPADIQNVLYPRRFFVDPDIYLGKTGVWYQWENGQKGESVAIVRDPSIDLAVWNQNSSEILSLYEDIIAGDYVNFGIKTNLNHIIEQRGKDLPIEECGIIDISGYQNTTNVQYDSLKGPLFSEPDKDISLKNLAVNPEDNIRWWWPLNDQVTSGWNTGILDSNKNRLYPNGEYTFTAEVTLNNISQNYPTESRVGKVISKPNRLTIDEDRIIVNITSSSMRSTRSNAIPSMPFYRNSSSIFANVYGKPNKEYIITIMDCDSTATDPKECCALKMSGAPCDRPPIIVSDQAGVGSSIWFDNSDGPFTIGDNVLSSTCNIEGTIRDVVPTDDKWNAKDVLYNGIYYYAKIKTDKFGKKTVEFRVDSDVAPDKPYRIHVQSIEDDFNKVISGDNLVRVNKGAITLNFVNKPPYYLGNQIILNGTSYDSKFVYLYMTGSICQNKCGNDLLYIKKADPANNVVQPFDTQFTFGCKEEIDQFTAIEVPVKSDGTWEYVWKTSGVPINPGTYTIHASSIPINDCCTECVCVATTARDMVFEEACFNLVIDPGVITRPIECCPNGCKATSLDEVRIYGNACGFPHTGSGLNTSSELNMWIFGEEKVGNYKYINAKVPVFTDDTVDFNLLSYIELCDLKPGDYTIILQHPMYNHKFDMELETEIRDPVDTGKIWMITTYPVEWSKLFLLDGTDYVQGEQAVNEIRKFDQQKLVDDKFLYLPFTIVDDRVPKAEFSGDPTKGSKPLEVQFTDKSLGKNLTSWTWNFGDETTSTERNPKHMYSESGMYSVSLTVANNQGDTDTATKPGYINVRDPLIKADFFASPTSGAAPLSVKFSDKSTGSPTNWFWDFGDGFTSAGVKDPSHVYQYGGKYTVTLTITLGDEIDRAIKKDYITVIGGPQPTPTIGPYDPTKIHLYSGWNFISVARTLADGYSNASAVFRDVPTGGHAIWAYDPARQYWDQVLTQTVIAPLNGYWIYSVTPFTINLTFKNDPISAPVTRSLPTGWAAIGFTGGNPATAKDTLKSVKDAWIYARGYDAQHQQWEATIVNGGQGENTYLFPSRGYWLYMEKPGTLAAIGV